MGGTREMKRIYYGKDAYAEVLFLKLEQFFIKHQRFFLTMNDLRQFIKTAYCPKMGVSWVEYVKKPLIENIVLVFIDGWHARFFAHHQDQMPFLKKLAGPHPFNVPLKSFTLSNVLQEFLTVPKKKKKISYKKK